MSEKKCGPVGLDEEGVFEVSESLPDFIRDHVRRYLESGGEDGHMWTPPVGGEAVSTLLLVTRGRKSGRGSTLPLIYGRVGERFVVVGSKGGAPTHPAWYLNLRSEPRAWLQVGAERFEVVARVAEGAERQELWDAMLRVFPSYAEYQLRAERQIPVVVLERASVGC